MSGTKAGGIKTALTNKRLHGDDFYARIGAKGGRNGHTGGFASDHERARIAGAKGGSISKRNEAKNWYEKNKIFIEDMIGDGKSYKEISEELNVSKQKIYYVMSKYGGGQ